MWSIFAARTLKPAFSRRARIWPATPLATASGLMMASVRSIVMPASFPEHLRDGRAHVGGAPDERGPRLLQRSHLLRRGALPSGDDGAGVAHASPGRRGLAADERDDRLLDAALDEGRRVLLGGPADLADQHDRLGPGIVGKEPEHVHEARAVHGVAADPD